MAVELPRCLLAERASLAVVVATGLMVEAVLARHPDMVAGPGVVLAAALAWWLWHSARSRPASLELGPDGLRLRYADGRSTDVTPAQGSRQLGGSIVLRWGHSGLPAGLWLTAADLPRAVLRPLALRLVAHGRRAGT